VDKVWAESASDEVSSADRRPVDPTPIVQLKVTSKAGDDLTSDSKGDGEKSLRRPEPGPNGASFMQSE
jgi:hypothetical protein